MVPSSPSYPVPWKVGFQILRDAILLRPRSLREDAIKSSQILPKQPKIIKKENIPSNGPCLLVINHYHQPDLGAWWIGLAVSAAVPLDIHWLMTAAWTFRDEPHLKPLTPLTYWLFSRVAKIYGFTSMPPMPPDPGQTEFRAASIRHALNYARGKVNPVIAMAPEGFNRPEGVLAKPPPGVGRFIDHLVKYCGPINPIGIYAEDEQICLSFGRAFELEVFPGASKDSRDSLISHQVMDEIALQLPQRLRGIYGSSNYVHAA